MSLSSAISFYIDQDTPGFRTTTGLLPTADAEVGLCALQVGDTVSFPQPPQPRLPRRQPPLQCGCRHERARVVGAAGAREQGRNPLSA